MRASQTAKPPVDRAEAATGMWAHQRAAPYSWSSVCQFEGTAPLGPGTGWSNGCEWGAWSFGPVMNSSVR